MFKACPVTVFILSLVNPATTLMLEAVAQQSAIPYREGIEFSVAKRDIAIGGQMLNIHGVHGEYNEIYLPLYGSHQASNAAVSLAAVEAFVGQKIADEIVLEAFASVTSPGRLEVIHRDPTVIVDAAHNPHGAKTLANTLQEEFTFGRVIAVVGIFADKDAAGIFDEIKDVIDGVIVTQSSSPRALAAKDLAKIAGQILGLDRVFIEPDLRIAIEKALSDANHPLEEETVGVLITGSVITVGEARKILKELKS